MLDDLVNGLAARVKELYPEFAIYDEVVRQGMKEPCFFIKVVAVRFRKELSGRYRLQVTIDLHYFNSKHNEVMNHDFRIVGQRISEELEAVSVADKVLRIGDKESKAVDDVLHVLFDVSVVLFRKEAEALMMAYELEGGLK